MPKENKVVAFRIDVIDLAIMEEIKSGKNVGTIQIAKNLGISPKGLIYRLKKHQEYKWVAIDKIKAKPKGWKRTFKITKEGETIMKWYKKRNEERRIEEELKRDFFKKSP